MASGNWFSDQWKSFCSISSNTLSTGSSFSILWKYILNECFITATGNGIILLSLLSLQGDHYLKKFYQWKPFSLVFTITDSNETNLMVHLNRIFKSFAFIQSFFLLVDTIHEIKYRLVINEGHYSCSLKPFSDFRIFADIPASRSSFFRLVEMDFSSNPS